MQTVKGVKVRCIKLLKNKVYKFARYILLYSKYCLHLYMSYLKLCKAMKREAKLSSLNRYLHLLNTVVVF